MPMSSLSLSDIGADFSASVTTQSYGGSAVIEGVQKVDLRLMADDGGSFAEMVRFTEDGTLEGFPQFRPRQTSYSEVLPGAVKAFHLHFNQEDVWFVPPTDRLLMGLIDCRKDSATYNQRMRFVLGAGRAQLLHIPRGVGHGVANLGTAGSRIIYFVNQQFDLANPDEHRLPWDMLGADFWQITQG